MHLKPGCKEEYIKRHREIWPELVLLIKAAGISEYSIFLDNQTNTLFAVQKSDDKVGSQDLGNQMIVKKWWDYMADLMEVNEDKSPVSSPLDEVFYLE